MAAVKGIISSDVVAAYRQHKSINRTAQALGLNRETIRRHLRHSGEVAKVKPKQPTGRVRATSAKRGALPSKGKVTRYICTSVQNNTEVPEELWNNIQALAKYYDAEILVGTFTYNAPATFLRPQKWKQAKADHTSEIWYDSKVMPHICDERIRLAPSLFWVGDANIIPTAVNPLSGFETLTGVDSAIFPASKIQVQSIPTAKTDPTKLNYTTGTVTKRNYIAQKAGMKADFHHTYGGVLVEIDHEGDWFVRQLNADNKWRIQDLHLLVENGVVSDGNPVNSIRWGDVHVDCLDPVVQELAWGPGGMLDELHPKFQIVDDILDFRTRNHHDLSDPHKMFRKFVEGRESVEEEVQRCANWTKYADRPWCQMVVVDANHDRAMTRWLKETNFKLDPVNAIFHLDCQRAIYKAMLEGQEEFHLLEWAMRRAGADKRIKFLRPDESFITCKNTAGGGIENGYHGDIGPNGSRGSVSTFRRLGRKVTRAHEHSASIVDSVVTVGTCTKMDVGYNVGPSSWSHTHCVEYPNGKRCLITMRNGKWRL